MHTPSRRLRAAVYCRISNDREGERLGVERQRQDCLARAEREGWEVVGVYEDNDLGASRVVQRQRPDGTWEAVSTPRRPAFEDMLGKAERGELDVIIAYSNSRLTRRMMELERLIQLHERTRVQIQTIVSGNDDLATADGQMTARIKASVDAGEAKRIGERVRRAAQQRREAGQFHGGRPPYGYDRVGKGELAINAERTAVVREAADRVLRGESVYGIWTDFNNRGIKTAPSPRAPQGTRWQGQTLRRILTSAATIGCHELDTGELIQVAEPILDRPTWQRLREILFDPGRRTGSPPDWSSRLKYPLSGLLFCAECGHWLSGAALPDRRPPGPDGKRRPPMLSFACVTATGGCGKLRIAYGPLERWVLDMVFARLDVPGMQEALSSPGECPDAEDLRRRIADAQRRLERLDDQYADGVLDDQRYRRQVQRLTEQITEMRIRLAETQRDVFIIDTGGRTLREAWTEHDATWQRTLLGHLIDKIVIEPHPAGVTTNLSRRRGEDDSSLAQRRHEHQERVLFQRVRISWKQ
jgi:DNA invertase Pin-like site-specific DNA recombinase